MRDICESTKIQDWWDWEYGCENLPEFEVGAHFALKFGHFCTEVRPETPLKLGSKNTKNNTGNIVLKKESSLTNLL